MKWEKGVPFSLQSDWILEIRRNLVNLGAKAVYLASSNLEKQLKAFEQEQLKPLIDHLERVMIQVIDGIASIEQGAEAS